MNINLKILLIFLLCLASAGHAKIGIRDTEIELALEQYSHKIIKASGLNPDTIDIHILPNNQINAFVAGGKNIFLYSGLITKTDTPEQLQGVIAHELGHILGGHIVRTAQAQENAFIRSLITTALVGAASVLAQGSGDAVAGSLLAGQQTALSSFMHYSRTQEAAADQSAVQILTKAQIPVSGLLELLEKLAEMERYRLQGTKSYYHSHPLSEKRVRLLQDAVKKDKNVYSKKQNNITYERIKAKLTGFLADPEVVLRQYPQNNTQIQAFYARAVAYHRLADLEKSLSQIDYLIHNSPDDPFYHELKGQILFESGKIKDALRSYKKAYSLLKAPLIGIGYAQALIEDGSGDSFQQAESLLKIALTVEKNYALAWHFLSVAYDRQQKESYAAYAIAEFFYTRQNYVNAYKKADYAFNTLPKNSVEWFRAKDILHQTKKIIRKMCEKGIKGEHNSLCL